MKKYYEPEFSTVYMNKNGENSYVDVLSSSLVQPVDTDIGSDIFDDGWRSPL